MTDRIGNLHAPTVPSGPTTQPTTNGTGNGSQTLAQLQAKKDNIEAEIKALSNVLDSHGVDMNTPLITPDGFPRADLDVAQVRTTRTRIIYLRNDYKALMADIEKHIHAHFARLAEEGSTEAVTTNRVHHEAAPEFTPPPPALGLAFAKVNSVVEGSPADSAGLKTGDEIRMFGYVNHENHDGLRRVGQCVQGNEGQNILVKVSRPVANSRRQELQLTLTPRSGWGGRGLLGCHILPL